VLDQQGRVLAGPRDGAGALVATAAYLREHPPPPEFTAYPGSNTTLAVVATDFALSRVDLHAVARQAMSAVVRRISPANTEYDGDLVFACSTGGEPERVTPAERLRIGLAAEWALAQAIERAVKCR
jgi:D-aminopeptidase